MTKQITFAVQRIFVKKYGNHRMCQIKRKCD